MANRKKIDRKGRPFKKLCSQVYIDYKHWEELRRWRKWGKKGNLNKFFKISFS